MKRAVTVEFWGRRMGQSTENNRCSVVLLSLPTTAESLAEIIGKITLHDLALPAVIAAHLPQQEAVLLCQRLKDAGSQVELIPNPSDEAFMKSPAILMRASDTVDPRRLIPGDGDVLLLISQVGDKKIQVIKEVRAITNLGLKEAKELVDGAPALVGRLLRSEADDALQRLRDSGASAEILDPLDDADDVRWSFDVLEWPEDLDPATREAIVSQSRATGVSKYLAQSIARTVEAAGGAVRVSPVG